FQPKNSHTLHHFCRKMCYTDTKYPPLGEKRTQGIETEFLARGCLRGVVRGAAGRVRQRRRENKKTAAGGVGTAAVPAAGRRCAGGGIHHQRGPVPGGAVPRRSAAGSVQLHPAGPG